MIKSDDEYIRERLLTIETRIEKCNERLTLISEMIEEMYGTFKSLSGLLPKVK